MSAPVEIVISLRYARPVTADDLGFALSIAGVIGAGESRLRDCVFRDDDKNEITMRIVRRAA